MDLWVVAVAAGAGYLGKYLQNLSLNEKEKKLLVSSSTVPTYRSSGSWNFLQQIRDRTCPVRRLAQEKAYKEVFREQKLVLDRNQFGDGPDSLFERASTSDKVKMVEDFNAQWFKNYPPKFSGRESFLYNAESSCRFCRNKLLKSRSSRETDLEKVEEPAHFSLAAAPPSRTMRLLCITDENQVTESCNHNSFDLWFNVGEDPSRRTSTHISLDLSEDTLRISNCSSFDSGCNVGEDISMMNASTDATCTCFSASSTNKMDDLQLQEFVTGSQERMIAGAFHSTGQSNDMLLFLMGLMIGILPTAAVNEREMQKMNDKLDQAMTLVQDLKEELDMKDTLTVKELVYDGSQPLSAKTPSSFNQEISLSSSEQEPKHSTSSVGKLADYNKEAENSQLMSTIEVELEAELERLERYMNRQRISDFVELDSKSEVNTIEGSIKLDALRRQYDSASESELDEGSDTTTRLVETPPANYAVSPLELSIRLHELVESQLEARIKELETALQINKNKLLSLESHCNTFLSPEYPNGESQTILQCHVEPSRSAIDV